MAIERSDPVPVGRYWIDAINAEAILTFDAWCIFNSGSVKVIKKEEFPAAGGVNLNPFDDDPMTFGAPGRNWYLFDVTKPTPRWKTPTKGLGLPNIVKSPTAPNAPAITNAAQTGQVPKPPTTSDMFSNMFGDVKTVAIVLGLLYLVSRK